jgi:putative transposase
VVRYSGREFGPAVAHRIGRHTHPKARPEQPGTAPEPTGIDYLRLIDTSHTERLEARINYAALTSPNPDPTDAPAQDMVVDLDAPATGRDDPEAREATS